MTLVVQMFVFGAFVWFTMKFVWPPICKALDERQAKIAEGLAAAERGRHELELAQTHVKKQLKQAKVQAAELVDKTHKRLRVELVDLVMSGMEKVIQDVLPDSAKKRAIEQLIAEIAEE